MNRSDRHNAGDSEKPGQVAAGDEAAKDPAAQALGSKGGKKRAERLTAQRRSEIAKLGASARWAQKQVPNERKADGER
ncbi:MAG: RNA-binding protein [Mesorhizobium sp.]